MHLNNRVVLSSDQRMALAENVTTYLDKNGLSRQDFLTHGEEPIDNNMLHQFIFNPKNNFPVSPVFLEKLARKMKVEVDRILVNGGLEDLEKEGITWIDLTDEQRANVSALLRERVETHGKDNVPIIRVVSRNALMDHIYNPEKPWKASKILLERLADNLRITYDQLLNGRKESDMQQAITTPKKTAKHDVENKSAETADIEENKENSVKLSTSDREAIAFNVENFMVGNNLNRHRLTKMSGLSFTVINNKVLNPQESWAPQRATMNRLAKVLKVKVSELKEPIGSFMELADRVRTEKQLNAKEVNVAALPAAEEISAIPESKGTEVVINHGATSAQGQDVSHSRNINLELADGVNFRAPTAFLKNIVIDADGVLHITLR
jgi:hypothetical protein